MQTCAAEPRAGAREADYSQSPLSVRRNAGWSLMGNAAYAGAQWLQLVIVARLGTTEQVGHFAYATAVCAPVFMLSNLQLRSAQVSDATGLFAAHEYIGLRCFTSAVALIGVAAGAALFADGAPWLPVVLAMAFAKAIESVSDVYQGYLQRRERMDLAGQSLLLKSLVAVLFCSAAQWLTGSVFASTLAIAACHLLTLVLFDMRAAASIGRIEYRLDMTSVGLQRLGSLAVRCLPLGITMSLLALQSSIPRLVIERFSGASAVGAFAAITYLANVGSTVISAAGMAASPRLARYAAHGKRGSFNRLLLEMIATALLIGGCGVAAAYFCGPSILAHIYGAGYSDYGNAFLICTVASTLWFVTSALGFAATAQGRFRAQPVAVSVSLVVLLAGLIALTPRLGINGAAIATAASAAVCMCTYLAIVWRTRNDKQRIRQ